ncbi:hypothetical protein ACX3OY_11475 [Citrobacter farmeri]
MEKKQGSTMRLVYQKTGSFAGVISVSDQKKVKGPLPRYEHKTNFGTVSILTPHPLTKGQAKEWADLAKP